MVLVNGKDWPNWIQIMMSGPFSVGKTSLVQSLLGQAFVSDYNKGIEVEVHKLGTLVDFWQAFWKWKQIQPKHAIKGACHVLLEDAENATFEANYDDIQYDSNNNHVDPGNVNNAISVTINHDPPGLYADIIDAGESQESPDPITDPTYATHHSMNVWDFDLLKQNRQVL
jgi:hypothetical protein